MDDTTTPLTRPKTNKLFSVCIFILGIELCERLCFYTLRGSLRTFFENTGGGSSTGTAVGLQQAFTVLCYFWPIAGGYIADNRLGRYRTIVYFAAIYVVGTWVMALAAYEPIMESVAGFWLMNLGALGLVAFGTGAIKSNVVTFGSDQYDESDPEEAAQRVSFFQYFYLVINVGGIFSSTWTVTIAIGGVTSSGPGMGFFHSFLIAASALTVGYLMFVAGTPRYQHKEKAVYRPTLSVIVKYMREGASRSGKGKLALMGWVMIPTYIVLIVLDKLLGTNLPTILKGFNDGAGVGVLAMGSFVAVSLSVFGAVVGHKDNSWVVELSRAVPGTEVTRDMVKDALRLIPTMFLVNAGFSICYNSMDIYNTVACQMDVALPQPFWQHLLLADGQVSGSFFQLADQAAIILFIPLFEKVFFPAYQRSTGRPVSRKTKYAIGFAFAILANVVAIVLEFTRRGRGFVPCPEEEMRKCSLSWNGISEDCACGPVRDVTFEEMNSTSNWYYLSKCASDTRWSVTFNNGTKDMKFQIAMSDMPALWMFVPNFITGMGEIMVNPVVQEYAYDECPSKLRSLMMGICMLASGSLSNSICAVFNFLIPNDLNKGNLIPYFVVVILLSIAAFGLYLCIATTDRRIAAISEH